METGSKNENGCYLILKLSRMEAIILQLPFLNEEKGREHSGAKYDRGENSDNS